MTNPIVAGYMVIGCVLGLAAYKWLPRFAGLPKWSEDPDFRMFDRKTIDLAAALIAVIMGMCFWLFIILLLVVGFMLALYAPQYWARTYLD